MTEKNAIALVKSKLSGYRVRKEKDLPHFFVFMCEAPDPQMMPSKIAVAVNKETSKIGTSIASFEEAVQAAK